MVYLSVPGRPGASGPGRSRASKFLCSRAVIRDIVDSMRRTHGRNARMPTESDLPTRAESAPGLDYDTVIIGAGISGLYQLYRLRELGQKVRVFEAGTGVGGTWYWNRYPGCRFDSESESYGYSWSPELLREWDWKEHYSWQPENERYLNFVPDKFDLRKDIQLNHRVTSAIYADRTNR